jgi:hypothetical protein
MSGDCICCWRWHRVLRKWKLRLWVEEWDRDRQYERVWLCEECRNLPREEVTARVQRNMSNLDVLPDLDHEPNCWTNRQPSPASKSHLRVVVSDGE